MAWPGRGALQDVERHEAPTRSSPRGVSAGTGDGAEKIFEELVARSFQNLLKDKFTESGGSVSAEEDKPKEIQAREYHNQTTENRRQRKNREGGRRQTLATQEEVMAGRAVLWRRGPGNGLAGKPGQSRPRTGTPRPANPTEIKVPRRSSRMKGTKNLSPVHPPQKKCSQQNDGCRGKPEPE